MVDFFGLIGIPPIILIYIMVKCDYEISVADTGDQEDYKLYWKCVIDNIDSLIPTGLPDPDKYEDDDSE